MYTKTLTGFDPLPCQRGLPFETGSLTRLARAGRSEWDELLPALRDDRIEHAHDGALRSFG